MNRRNHHVYGPPSLLARLADEYRWLGRATQRPGSDHLIVLAINPLDLTKHAARFK